MKSEEDLDDLWQHRVPTWRSGQACELSAERRDEWEQCLGARRDRFEGHETHRIDGADQLRRHEPSAERVSAPKGGCAASSQMVAHASVVAPTAADSTATVELTDSCTLVDPQGAGIGLRRRGCGALSRASHNRGGRSRGSTFCPRFISPTRRVSQ